MVMGLWGHRNASRIPYVRDVDVRFKMEVDVVKDETKYNGMNEFSRHIMSYLAPAY
jgi:hypothetical protein